ncbi:MAG TPA: TIGR03118 family protein [Bacteroidales bacterium]|nr:TIGR03118 family protein [Bacteroidales bacterium]
MKKLGTKYTGITSMAVFTVLLAAALAGSGCKKSKTTTPMITTYGPSMQIVYLVSNVSGFGAANIDPNLVDAWGIAISPNGRLWVSSAQKGLTTIYDGTGATVLNPVTVSSATRGAAGAPTGVVYNGTTDFMIPSAGAAAKFIYAGGDGSVSGWSSGDSTVVVATKSGAVYTGIAMANDGTGNFLYLANYGAGTIDVLDSKFNFVSGKSFSDPSIPTGFNPYNVVNIGGMLYVAYAAVPNGPFEIGGVNGYVNIFNPNGTLVKRFAGGTNLFSPWGITPAPDAMGLGSNMILVGNFLDGHISVYDADGNYKGQLQSGGTIITIDGLWALTEAPSGASSLDQTAIYFAAGPQFETEGAVGYFKKQ